MYLCSENKGAFVFAYAKSRFSHVTAHIILLCPIYCNWMNWTESYQPTKSCQQALHVITLNDNMCSD